MTGFRHRRQKDREAVCRRFLKDSRTGFDRWVEGKLKDPSFREAYEEAKKEITPMKIETLQLGLVDAQPIFAALTELKQDFLPKETRQFLLFQLRTTIKELRRNAKYVEERLAEMEPLLPTEKRIKRAKTDG